MKQRILALLLALALCCSLLVFPASAADTATSGTCGENVTWTLSKNGVLTISGTGAMTDYSNIGSPFYQNLSITSVVIKSGVTSIGAFAFSDCSSLTGVTIPDSVTSIGYYAFSACTSLAGVTIPDSVTSIGNNAFWRCSSLTSITIPDSITSINGSLFSGCSSLTSVTIPDSVTSIGWRAFWGCSSLASITIPDSVTSIENTAFAYCSSLTSVTIPAAVTSIGEYVFSACSSLKSIEVSSGNTECCSLDGVLFPKDQKTILSYPAGKADGSYVIPDSVTSIGGGAFSGCSSLTSVTIPESVTNIGGEAFSDCSSLESVTIPDGVTSIESYTFYNCSSLTNITIPDSVTNIGQSAFSNCSSLKDVYYGGTEEQTAAVTIGSDNDSLTSATIHYTEPAADVPDEGDYEALHWAVTSDGVLTISGTGTIPSNSTFGWDSWIDTVNTAVIHNGVTGIGNDAFINCGNLVRVTIPDGVTSIGCSVFEACTSLESVTIPDGVTSIERGTFYDCSSLASVSIPESVTRIGDYAFYGCRSLESVMIPDSVTSIGTYTFSECRSLTDVYYGGTEEQWNAISIGSDNDSLTSATIHYTEPAPAIVARGACGENVTWTLDENGLLTIRGTGDMYDFNSNNSRPWYSERVRSLVIESGITSIGESAFYDCNQLKSVSIPDSVKSIGASAFCYCSNLTSVTIPDGVSSIRDYTFSGCSSLVSVTIPVAVTSIGNWAFNNCRLTSVSIPDRVVSIGERAFINCCKLECIAIPKSVTNIGSEAFNSCFAMTEIRVDPENSKYQSDQGVLLNKEGTKLIRCPEGKTGGYAIPQGVIGIGDCAFENCSSLTSVTIPDSVTSIGEGAFAYCIGLPSITIPDSVTSIGEGAFANCSSLTSVTIPDSVTSIGGGAFSGCSSLTSVTLPDGVTSIGDFAFDYCDSLTSVIIPDSVTSIGCYSFANCDSLISLTIPDSVTNIGSYAFSYCDNLARMTIPNGVTVIEDSLFFQSRSLTSVTIPDSVTTIGRAAFWDCSGLTDVYYGGTEEQWSAITIGSENDPLTAATIHYTEPAYVLDESDYEALHWVLTSDGVLTISGSGKVDYQVCACWSEWIDFVKSVVIQSGVTGIESNPFYNCSSLKEFTVSAENVNLKADQGVLFNNSGTELLCCPSARFSGEYAIPDGVMEIGDQAFYGCSGLTCITIPDSVASIGHSAFRDCSSLASVNIPQGISRIENITFYGCSSLTNVVIPDSITSIGIGAFYRCSSLTSVNIPEGVTTVESEAFRECSSLTSVNLPESLTSIEGYAFGGCRSLENVTIPNRVTNIGIGAFNDSGLTEITIPASVTSIGKYAFQNCDDLTEIQVEEDNPNYQSDQGVLLNKEGTQLITCPRGKAGTYVIPQGVRLILDSAFGGCSGITNVTIPNTVISIGREAFIFCGITSITIPDGVEKIGETAFGYCDNLERVTISDSVTNIETGAFTGCYSLKNVYYSGNENQWKAISIGDYNEPLTTATIHYAAYTPGKIDYNPSNVTIPTDGAAKFIVVASGDVVSYQWQYKTPTGSWKNCTAATDGYNSAVLTVQGVTGKTNRNGYQYRCVVTDQDGNSVTSRAAKLTVASPVVITDSPSDSSTMVGRIAAFAVQAEGEGLTYQWQYLKPGRDWVDCTAATVGYNTPFLIVQGVSNGVNRNGYQYRCVVTDAYGNTAISESALMTVFAIRTQPKAASASADGKAVFKVVATGSDLSYQWQYLQPGGKWKNCTSATQGYNTATLTVQGESGGKNRNGYQYRCIVTSGSQSVTSTAAKLTVQ